LSLVVTDSISAARKVVLVVWFPSAEAALEAFGLRE